MHWLMKWCVGCSFTIIVPLNVVELSLKLMASMHIMHSAIFCRLTLRILLVMAVVRLMSTLVLELVGVLPLVGAM